MCLSEEHQEAQEGKSESILTTADSESMGQVGFEVQIKIMLQ